MQETERRELKNKMQLNNRDPKVQELPSISFHNRKMRTWSSLTSPSFYPEGHCGNQGDGW